MKQLFQVFLATTVLATTATSYAATFDYSFTLAPEAAGATGSGSASASFDDATNVFSYAVSFSGLSGDTTVAHFHCCTATAGSGTAGVAVDVPSLLNFPVGVQAGSFSGSYDLSDTGSFNPSFLTSAGGTAATAAAAFLSGLDSGRAYLNIHSTTFPGGEIRSFAQRVPEPGTLALLGLGLIGLGVIRRKAT